VAKHPTIKKDPGPKKEHIDLLDNSIPEYIDSNESKPLTNFGLALATT